MKFVFIVTQPGQKPRQFELRGNRIGVGREVDNDISLPVESISSSHLEFCKVDEAYELRDLNSTNGTRVNGKSIQLTKLVDGDRILIGETVPAHFVVLADGEKWEAGTAAGSEDDQASAAEYASMSDRLEVLESNIEAKEKEEAQLESRLAELRNEHAEKQAEFEKAQAALDQLQSEIDQKKQSGQAGEAEMQQLEEDLMQETQKVKLMASDLEAQQQNIQELENSQDAPVPAAVPKAVPPKAGPVLPKPRRPGVPAGAGPRTVKLTKPLPKRPGPGPMVVKKKKPGGP